MLRSSPIAGWSLAGGIPLTGSVVSTCGVPLGGVVFVAAEAGPVVGAALAAAGSAAEGKILSIGPVVTSAELFTTNGKLAANPKAFTWAAAWVSPTRTCRLIGSVLSAFLLQSLTFESVFCIGLVRSTRLAPLELDEPEELDGLVLLWLFVLTGMG